MFDDTYPHEVHNETNGVRVVLFMDILRPLRFPGSLLNNIVIRLVRRSGYIQEAKRNQERWEQRLGPSAASATAD
jgi:beta-hydroxylase